VGEKITQAVITVPEATMIRSGPRQTRQIAGLELASSTVYRGLARLRSDKKKDIAVMTSGGTFDSQCWKSATEFHKATWRYSPRTDGITSRRLDRREIQEDAGIDPLLQPDAIRHQEEPKPRSPFLLREYEIPAVHTAGDGPKTFREAHSLKA
jgi:hypothetical protein